MLSFNLINVFKDNKCKLFSKNNEVVNDASIIEFIDSLCLYSGGCLKSSLNASARLLKNTKKLPIYLAAFNDYLIPLSSPTSKDCIWFSAKNYLTCFEMDYEFYIKFKDRSIIKVDFSTYTIKNQYNKYLSIVDIRSKLHNKLSNYL